MDVYNFVGSAVSIQIKANVYQGRIVHVDKKSHTIMISNIICDGVPCKEKEMLFKASDITDLQLVTATSEARALPEMKQNIHQEKAPSEHLEPKPALPAATSHSFSPADKRLRNSPSRVQTASPVKNGYIKPRDLCQRELSKSAPKTMGFDAWFAEQTLKPSNTLNCPRITAKPANTDSGYEGMESPVKALLNGASRLEKPLRNGNNFDEEFDFDSNLALFDKKKFYAEVKRGGATGTNNKYKQAQSRRSPRPNGKTPTKNQDRLHKTQQREQFDEDFDFETNNAMFDKQAVFEEIENGISVGPVVKEPSQPAKYGCHENVLQSGPVEFRQICFVDHEKASSFEYVTDSGLIIPCIDEHIRKQLFAEASKLGIPPATHVETIGRSAAEMVLQLCGGSHRLSPKNAHQRPCVVILVGEHFQGSMALSCARQLASHQVNVTVFMLMQPGTHYTQVYQQIHMLEHEDNVKITQNVKDLPSSPLDIIINAFESHDVRLPSEPTQPLKQLLAWVKNVRAPILALDPPYPLTRYLQAKWQLAVGLPLEPTRTDDPQPKLYIMDLCIPKKVYEKVGIKYESPFENKYVIPVHPHTT